MPMNDTLCDILPLVERPSRYLGGEYGAVRKDRAKVDISVALVFPDVYEVGMSNIGLAILECPEASEKIQAGDEVAVDFDTGVIKDETTGKTWQAEPFPPFIKEMIAQGGLMASLKLKKKTSGAA